MPYLESESPGHIVRANKYPARWPYRRAGGSTATRRASDSPTPIRKGGSNRTDANRHRRVRPR